MQRQSYIDVNKATGATERNLLELIESGTLGGT